MMLCSVCRKRPAVFFLSLGDSASSTKIGLCMQCAQKINAKSLYEMIQPHDNNTPEKENIDSINKISDQIAGIISQQ